MRKIVAPLLAVALIAGAVAAPAVAKKKKKKPPAPVATTMYMDGTQQFGEAEGLVYMKLVAEEPAAEKSMQLINYGGGPNTNCGGNALFPVFVGGLAGKIQGEMKITFNTMSTPGAVDVRVWPDLNAQVCNEAYVEPAGAATVDLAPGPGTVEVTLTDLNFDVSSVLMVQVSPVTVPPFVGRMFYGTADSKVEFSCIPVAPATTCTT